MSLFEVTILGCLGDALSFAIGLILWSRLSRPYRLLAIFYTFAIVIDGIIVHLSYHRLPNAWPLSIFAQLEFAAWCLFLSYHNKNPFRGILRVSVSLFFLIWVGLLIAGFSVHWLYYFFSTLEPFLILAFSTYTAYKIAEDCDTTLIYSPAFWTCTGLVIYFASCIFIFGITYFKAGGAGVWGVHTALNLIAHLFYTGGFLLQSRLQIGGSLASVPRFSWSWLLALSAISLALING